MLPGSVNQSGARTGSGGASTLTPADGMAIAGLPHVSAVSPAVTVRAQVVGGGNNWQTTVSGVAPTYTYMRPWPLAEGTFFSDADWRRRKVACSVRPSSATSFPDGTDPIGQTVLIKNVPFTVVGTLVAERSERRRAGPGRHGRHSLHLGDAAPDRRKRR